MNHQNNPGDRGIAWRTRIRLDTDGGFLTSQAVRYAARGLDAVADTIELFIDGRLTGITPWAMHHLGAHLAAAGRVDIIAHGPGAPALRQAIERAIAEHRQWDAGGAQRATQDRAQAADDQ